MKKDRMSVSMNSIEQKIYERHQHLTTMVIYKFAHLGGKERKNNWNNYVGLETLGLTLNDMYQLAHMKLIDIIERLVNNQRRTYNLNSYLFKALYRQMKMTLNKQRRFVSIERISVGTDHYVIDQRLDYEELKSSIELCISKLKDEHRTVLKHTYGLNGLEIKTQKRIARESGVCQQTISQRHESALKAIRGDKDLMERLKTFRDMC